MPRQLVVRRASILPWRADRGSARAEPVDQASAGTDWRAAVAALGKVLTREARHVGRVQIGVSDLWVRSHLIPATAGSLGEDEMLLLAHGHFARQYPQTGQDAWTLRLAQQGPHLLAAAIETALLEAIKASSANSGAKLTRIEPLFCWVYDRFEKALADANGWLLLDEPGMLSLALVTQGRLVSLHSQRCETAQDEVALRLLERQSALLAQPSVEVRVVGIEARQIRLPAPWRIIWQRRIFAIDDSAGPAAAPAPLSRQH